MRVPQSAAAIRSPLGRKGVKSTDYLNPTHHPFNAAFPYGKAGCAIGSLIFHPLSYPQALDIHPIPLVFAARRRYLKGWWAGLDNKLILHPCAPAGNGLPRQTAICLAMTGFRQYIPLFPANAPAKNPKRSDVFSRRGGARS